MSDFPTSGNTFCYKYPSHREPRDTPLTDLEKCEIRGKFQWYNMTVPQLAAEFRVSTENIESALKERSYRRSWKLSKEAIQKRSGENNFSSKLTADKVLAIREKWATGQYSQIRLADEFNIHKSTISNVVVGRSWRFLLPPDFAPFRRICRPEKYGEKNPISKLTAEKVAEIRAGYSSGQSTYHLAEKFGVCRPTITRILSGKTWRHTLSEGFEAPKSMRLYGEKIKFAKITAQQAREIYACYHSGSITQDKLAVEYGINRVTVQNICSGNTWKQATQELREVPPSGSLSRISEVSPHNTQSFPEPLSSLPCLGST